MSNSTVDASKRTWLIASSCAGAVGAGFVAVPFVSSFEPSERAKAAGAPVEVDISALQPGQKMTVEWRGKPVWIVRRTPEMLKELPTHDNELADPQSKRTAYPVPENCKNEWRSIKPEYLVLVGICTHLGNTPTKKNQPNPQHTQPNNKNNNNHSPNHGSTFDLAGRVYKNKPAPDNLEVPPYKYLSDTRLLIGEETKA